MGKYLRQTAHYDNEDKEEFRNMIPRHIKLNMVLIINILIALGLFVVIYHLMK